MYELSWMKKLFGGNPARSDINLIDGKAITLTDQVSVLEERFRLDIPANVLASLYAGVAIYHSEVAFCLHISQVGDIKQGRLIADYFDIVHIGDDDHPADIAYVEAENEYIEAGLRSMSHLAQGETFNCWGHTHPNMNVRPSSTDNKGWGKLFWYNVQSGLSFTNYFLIFGQGFGYNFWAIRVDHIASTGKSYARYVDIFVNDVQVSDPKYYAIPEFFTELGKTVTFSYKNQTIYGTIIGRPSKEERERGFDFLVRELGSAQKYIVPKSIVRMIKYTSKGFLSE